MLLWDSAAMSPYHKIHVLVVFAPGFPNRFAPLIVVPAAHDEDRHSVHLIIRYLSHVAGRSRAHPWDEGRVARVAVGAFLDAR